MVDQTISSLHLHGKQIMDYLIRRMEPEDYAALHHILSGPKAVWGTLQVPFPSLEMWRKRLAEPREGLIGLLALHKDEVVGQISLGTFPNSPRRRHVGDIGMAVQDDWHGRGVGTALLRAAVDLADGWLNLARLELTVYADNEAAINLYRKFGFEIEGTLRQYAFRNGLYEDVLAMARLRNQPT